MTHPTIPDPKADPRTRLPAHPDVQVESNEVPWVGRFPMQRVRFRHRRFDGAMSGVKTWEMMRRGAAAAVLPYDPVTDQLLLIEQFRLPALAAGFDPVLVELPAGMCDGADTAEQTAHKEMAEETGLAVDRLHRIGSFLLSPGGIDESVTLFAGRLRAPPAGPDGVVGTGGLASEQEDIRILLRPADAAIAQALDGAITNIITATALLWFAARRDWLRATFLALEDAPAGASA